ncbi:MAG: hypothetical protein Q9219_003028 [cf. Caloplaca sp. 3 TL-2023]
MSYNLSLVAGRAACVNHLIRHLELTTQESLPKAAATQYFSRIYMSLGPKRPYRSSSLRWMNGLDAFPWAGLLFSVFWQGLPAASSPVERLSSTSEEKSSKTAKRQPGRFWNKVSESWKAVVRALSLSLIVHAFRRLRHPTGRGFHEPTKIAMRQSRQIALLRNLVHLIPFGFALFEIILNWNVYYLGTNAYSTAVYQIFAKAHEVLIQASITAIVFSAIRRDLALGKGLPFGLLFSGLQISQISYLWSVELWGALKTDLLRPSRKVTLFALQVDHQVLFYSSRGYNRGQQVTLISGSTPPWTTSGPPNVSNSCPASEWYVIRNWLSATRQTPSPSYVQSLNWAEEPISSIIQGKNSPRQLYIASESDYIDQGIIPAIATTQQAVVSDALVSTGALWALSLINVTSIGHGASLNDQSDAALTIAENYSQPYSVAVCIANRIRNSSDSRPVALPLLPEANSPDLANGELTYGGFRQWHSAKTIEHPNLRYHQLSETPGKDHDYRIRWIELSEDRFNGSSIGAAMLLPEPTTEEEANVLLCNIAAGWGTTSLAVENRDGGFSSVNSRMRYRDFEIAQAPITLIGGPEAEANADTKLYSFSYPYFPQQPINISESWAQYLDPVIEGANTSVINALMQQQLFSDRDVVTATNMLPGLVVNGLARIGWDSVLQGEVKSAGPNGQGGLDGNYWLSGKGDVFEVDPAESKDWATFRVDSTLDGYAYNTLTVPPRIAIAFLTAYCLLVVGHTLYSGITGISSNCWDSIAEVTALAINSTPTAALRNTCAGITELYIFKLPVRILVSKDEEGEGQHLELVFGKVDEDEKEVHERTVKANRTYGTLPKGVQGRKDVLM